MVNRNQQFTLYGLLNSKKSLTQHITERLVKQGLEDTVKVIADYYSAPKKIRKTIDTGGYKLLYKGI
jgi:hypothetical protein